MTGTSIVWDLLTALLIALVLLAAIGVGLLALHGVKVVAARRGLDAVTVFLEAHGVNLVLIAATVTTVYLFAG